MKSFSTVRDPERITVLHGEEKRGEGVRGDPNEMRWNQKKREINAKETKEIIAKSTKPKAGSLKG